jgi:hypothetical protein
MNHESFFHKFGTRWRIGNLFGNEWSRIVIAAVDGIFPGGPKLACQNLHAKTCSGQTTRVWYSPHVVIEHEISVPSGYGWHDCRERRPVIVCRSPQSAGKSGCTRQKTPDGIDPQKNRNTG